MFIKILLLLLLAKTLSVFGALDCSKNQIYKENCTKDNYNEFYALTPGDKTAGIILAAVLVVILAVLPIIINVIIMIVMATKPLQRDPTPEDIESIEEDEDVVGAKNDEYMKNMKRKLPSQKAKNQPMKEFTINNENVNKEDDHTVPIQPVAGGGQSAVSVGGTGATGANGGATGATGATGAGQSAISAA